MQDREFDNIRQYVESSFPLYGRHSWSNLQSILSNYETLSKSMIGAPHIPPSFEKMQIENDSSLLVVLELFSKVLDQAIIVRDSCLSYNIIETPRRNIENVLHTILSIWQSLSGSFSSNRNATQLVFSIISSLRYLYPNIVTHDEVAKFADMLCDSGLLTSGSYVNANLIKVCAVGGFESAIRMFSSQVDVGFLPTPGSFRWIFASVAYEERMDNVGYGLVKVHDDMCRRGIPHDLESAIYYIRALRIANEQRQIDDFLSYLEQYTCLLKNEDMKLIANASGREL